MAYKAFQIDRWLLLSVLVLTSIGLLVSMSVGNGPFERSLSENTLLLTHALFLLFGVLTLWAFSRIDYQIYGKIRPFLYLALIVLVLLLLLPGGSLKATGARRWLTLGSFSLDISAYLELLIILLGASVISQFEKRRDWKGFLTSYGVILIGAIILFFLPKIGAAQVLFLTGTFLIFIAGYPVLWLIWGSSVFFLSYALISRPRYLSRARLASFVNPWMGPLDIGYQLRISLISLAGGGLTGVGLGKGLLRHNLASINTDLVLVHVGEEFGLLGFFVVLLFFGLLAYRGFAIALRCRDPFGRFLAYGISTYLLLKVLVHSAFALNLLPLAVFLPFISYGISENLVHFAMVGILLNISRPQHAPAYSPTRGEAFINTLERVGISVQNRPTYRILSIVALMFSLVFGCVNIYNWFR
jgi:cell division protein FtsW